jgi:hypothetical protein
MLERQVDSTAPGDLRPFAGSFPIAILTSRVGLLMQRTG